MSLLIKRLYFYLLCALLIGCGESDKNKFQSNEDIVDLPNKVISKSYFKDNKEKYSVVINEEYNDQYLVVVQSKNVFEKTFDNYVSFYEYTPEGLTVVEKRVAYKGGYKSPKLMVSNELKRKCIELKSEYFPDNLYIYVDSGKVIIYESNADKWETIETAGKPLDPNNLPIKRRLVPKK